MSIFMKIETPVAVQNETKKGFKLTDFFSVHALPIAIVVVIVSIAYSSVLSFIQFFAQENNLVDAASFFFVVYAIAILLTRPFTGRIMDQRGEYCNHPSIYLFSIRTIPHQYSKQWISIINSRRICRIRLWEFTINLPSVGYQSISNRKNGISNFNILYRSRLRIGLWTICIS